MDRGEPVGGDGERAEGRCAVGASAPCFACSGAIIGCVTGNEGITANGCMFSDTAGTASATGAGARPEGLEMSTGAGARSPLRAIDEMSNTSISRRRGAGAPIDVTSNASISRSRRGSGEGVEEREHGAGGRTEGTDGLEVRGGGGDGAGTVGGRPTAFHDDDERDSRGPGGFGGGSDDRDRDHDHNVVCADGASGGA